MRNSLLYSNKKQAWTPKPAYKGQLEAELWMHVKLHIGFTY